MPFYPLSNLIKDHEDRDEGKKRMMLMMMILIGSLASGVTPTFPSIQY